MRAEDYHFIASRIRQVAEVCCRGKVVSILEGGYGRVPSTNSAANSVGCCEAGLELDDFSANVTAHLRALAHLPLKEEQKSQVLWCNTPLVSPGSCVGP